MSWALIIFSLPYSAPAVPKPPTYAVILGAVTLAGVMICRYKLQPVT